MKPLPSSNRAILHAPDLATLPDFASTGAWRSCSPDMVLVTPALVTCLQSTRVGACCFGGGTRQREPCGRRVEVLAVSERLESPAAGSASPTPKHKNKTFLEISFFQKA